MAVTSSSLPPSFLSPSCLSQGQDPPPPCVLIARTPISAHRKESLETELSETSSRDKRVRLYIVCWASSGDKQQPNQYRGRKKKRDRTNCAQHTETPVKMANKVPRGHRQGYMMDKERDSESPVIAALLVSSLALLDVTPESCLIPSLPPSVTWPPLQPLKASVKN